MSSLVSCNYITNNNISEETLERASKAKETIEAYYSNFKRLQQERNERLEKINFLLNQEMLSDEEKLKESFFIICPTIEHQRFLENMFQRFLGSFINETCCRERDTMPQKNQSSSE